jgi:undecaprenyl-diphosphatase
MLEVLRTWDARLFFLINEHWTSPLLDRVLPWLTDARHYTIPFILGALALLVAWRLRGLRFLLMAVVGVLIADAISTHLVKHVFWRTRPCVALEAVRLLAGCVNSPSFPSNHAVNGSALATLAVLHLPKMGPLALALAFVVGYSRVYVGAHYPLDVLVGSILGILIALVLSRVMTLIWPPDLGQKERRDLITLGVRER